ncbi:class I SAM-dependent methyltransferase [Shimia sp. FJ5]|uniref:class I SAM-dependent methyltransferase n=1 Tax=Shimia sp. FJ5 TaxID=3079054 RepID=UPI00262D2846|nr:class I SAM-dependent methyltransferase [Shimia sp. FJ5]MDV4146070.1 class I SAM-dependent methyltransferase [Shimia sp. FJ5]
MTAHPPRLDEIKSQTQAVYARQAAAWDRSRQEHHDTLGLYEQPWLQRWLDTLPRPARLLDLGCGSGRPIAPFLLQQGHHLTGYDYSPEMIALAKQHFPTEDWPNANWQVADIRALPEGPRFDGILSWDGVFHLSPEEQRAALPRMAALLRPGGAMMLTVGYGEGAVTGTVNSETVYHASLSTPDYIATLKAAGFQHVSVTPNDASVLGRCVLLATGFRPDQQG